MPIVSDPPRPLGRAELDHFIRHGYVRIDAAFPRELAEEARTILWRDTGCAPDDTSTWTRPVIRLGYYSQEPFRAATNTAVLASAFDQLVGPGGWLPPASVGTFPVRFPSAVDPGDCGWHVDPGFGTENPDFMEWRVNISSRGRALLMLLLFSDVGPLDAPTRIRTGSHLDIARQLAPAGDAGLTLRKLAADGFAGSAHRPEVAATGEAGTVYLCHPLLVHAAQPHRGTRPRFMAQPPLLPAAPLRIGTGRSNYSPVEQAIRLALDGKA